MNSPELAHGPVVRAAPHYDRPAKRAKATLRAARAIDELALVHALQGSLEPATLLGIFSERLSEYVVHEGLSLVHPEFAAHVGDGGFFSCDWPLDAKNRSAGQLRIHTCEPPDEQSMVLLRRITPWLAQPMSNALTCERLRRHAREDALTGLLNRAALERILPREVSLSRREHTPLSLLMIDVDHFKQINDRWGHALGDRALVLMAEVLRECLRQSDLAFRYGGEEFVVALPDTDPSGACQAATRILARLRDHSNRHLPQLMTASIGVATLEADAANESTELLQRADRALYLAKGQGRNCVVSA